jgi:hypothetical protein
MTLREGKLMADEQIGVGPGGAAVLHLSEGPGAFIDTLVSQTPWWIVSTLMHVLIIALASLASMAVNLTAPLEPMVTTTIITPPTEFPQQPVEPPKPGLPVFGPPTPATATNSTEASNIFAPLELMKGAKVGNHWETVDLDRPNKHTAFGSEESTMFWRRVGRDGAVGGGGVGGTRLDEVIGFNGDGSPGSGGGWGGGKGKGQGRQIGDGNANFGWRLGGGGEWIIKGHGGAGTPPITRAALHWLAYHQEADGHWDARKYGAQYKTDTAVTALSLLAFLGLGHTEKVGDYKDNVKRAVAWLKSKQAPTGLIFDTSDEGRHYGEGYPGAMATLALVEAAGMANIPDTRAAAQKAIDYCTETHQAGEGSE